VRTNFAGKRPNSEAGACGKICTRSNDRFIPWSNGALEFARDDLEQVVRCRGERCNNTID
jgi:hypothetical protein